MGRTQAAYGSSFDHSRKFDRLATQDVFNNERAHGSACPDATGACGVLPSFAPPPLAKSGKGKNFYATDQEVILWELWYQLPEEEQVRFGDCFSRMILKILKRYDGVSSEEGI